MRIKEIANMCGIVANFVSDDGGVLYQLWRV